MPKLKTHQIDELQNEIKELRRQRDCLYKNFGIGSFFEMPKDLIKVLEELGKEENG